eukprot:6645014-Pyramimonas_sp.AAC.1
MELTACPLVSSVCSGTTPSRPWCASCSWPSIRSGGGADDRRSHRAAGQAEGWHRASAGDLPRLVAVASAAVAGLAPRA